MKTVLVLRIIRSLLLHHYPNHRPLSHNKQMKTKQKVAILALAALVNGTSHAAITGKSSGFMDKRQPAAWRA